MPTVNIAAMCSAANSQFRPVPTDRQQFLFFLFATVYYYSAFKNKK